VAATRAAHRVIMITMCDTFVALSGATASGEVLLAKNSDREPNEAHEVVFAPASEHAAGDRLRCTYIEVPQVRRTHAVLLAKPFWMWGAEMGANEHGVVIGNEAVFTRLPYEQQDGLIGMDLLRLALERADTAEEAVITLTDLLAQYGQGGDGGFTHELRYHNSFLVADPGQAWVLETVGREWAARRVERSGSISNVLTIGQSFDTSSPGLVDLAVAKGWCSGPADFDLAAQYGHRLIPWAIDARVRQCRTTDSLAADRGRVDLASAWALMSDHGPRSDGRSDWGPADHAWLGLQGQTVCAHAGLGPIRVSQTTGSWISQLPADGTPHTHWVTGTSAPCLSIRKPLWFDSVAQAGLPDTGRTPSGGYAPGSLWWDHEDLHRAVLRDYPRLRQVFVAERSALQARIDEMAAQAVRGTTADRVQCSKLAFAEAAEATHEWTARVRRAAPARAPRGLFHQAWWRFDRAAGRG
jgi:dipeptidase